MSFLVVTLAVALGLALLTGGSLARVLETRLRTLWALFLALAVQMALDLLWSGPGNGISRLLLGVSYALLIWFCLANVTVKGMAVVAFGIALNALVIIVNGGMPIRTDPGFAETVKHHAERPSDSLTFLGDIIVLGPLNQALSFGDLILLVGLVDVLVHRSRPVPTRRRPMAMEALEAVV
ncbi:MAG: DUF5317 family protein [Acidimicrobiia bacterium]